MTGSRRAPGSRRGPSDPDSKAKALDRAVPHGDVGVPPGEHAGAARSGPGWEIAQAQPVAIDREVVGLDIDRADAGGIGHHVMPQAPGSRRRDDDRHGIDIVDAIVVAAGCRGAGGPAGKRGERQPGKSPKIEAPSCWAFGQYATLPLSLSH